LAAKDSLEANLKNIFTALRAMSSGGDDYLAAQLAGAIDAYVKTLGLPAGSVIVQVSGGSGAPAVGAPNPAPLALSG
jgi:hypothetical protein